MERNRSRRRNRWMSGREAETQLRFLVVTFYRKSRASCHNSMSQESRHTVPLCPKWRDSWCAETESQVFLKETVGGGKAFSFSVYMLRGMFHCRQVGCVMEELLFIHIECYLVTVNSPVFNFSCIHLQLLTV